MKLCLDHHYSSRVAVLLRESGHDVVAAFERGWQVLADDELLEICAVEQRAIVTNNAVDFVPLAREWAAQGRPHCGIVLTSDRSFPRRRAAVGLLVRALDLLLARETDLDDRVVWLAPA